ncbi:hypothetical protein FRC03_010167 [Tulasnella sp. 419]|nr:hypothetical protein FRC02_008904 [Tulasnella sp. 418]KAG8967322.1 hypothetical protein FRC03_010167 [Tulasnella sp. 419]
MLPLRIFYLLLCITPVISDTEVFSLCVNSKPSATQTLASELYDNLAVVASVEPGPAKHLQIRPCAETSEAAEEACGEMWIRIGWQSNPTAESSCLFGRLSWPASFPADFAVHPQSEAVEYQDSEPRLYSRSVRILASNRGKLTPNSYKPAVSSHDGSPELIPIIVVVDALTFGLVPGPILWTISLILVFTLAAIWRVSRLLAYLEDVLDQDITNGS